LITPVGVTTAAEMKDARYAAHQSSSKRETGETLGFSSTCMHRAAMGQLNQRAPFQLPSESFPHLTFVSGKLANYTLCGIDD